MGLLGTFLGRFLGRGSAGELREEAAASGLEPSSAEDRLRRIARRGKEDVAAPRAYAPPPADAEDAGPAAESFDGPEPPSPESPAPFQEDQPASWPADEPVPPLDGEEPVPAVPPPADDPPAPLPDEEPVDELPMPPVEEEPSGEPSPRSFPAEEPTTAPRVHAPPPDDEPPAAWPDEEPAAAEPAPDLPPPSFAEEEPVIPPEFMPVMPEEPQGEFALAAKAGIRRPGLGLSPMGPGDLAPEPIEPGDRTAVVFRQIFPPPHGQNLSFFGGAPIASPGLVWPRPQGGGAPYSFLMQVDCAAVAPHARMGMPDRGILYVFMDLTWGQQDAYRVIHEEAPADELAEVALPDDLPPAFGEEAKHLWKWPRTAEDLPRLLPKWPFEPVALDIPADSWNVDGADEESLALWPGGELVNEMLLAAQGEEVGADWFTVKDFIADDGSLIRPFGHFPHDARAIQIVSGLLLKQLQGRLFSTRAKELEALSEEERAALFQRIAAEAQEWFDDAASEPAFGPVPQEVAEQYWTWLSSFPWLARFVMIEAMNLSIEASLAASPEAAARVPPEVARRVRSRHALAVRTETGLHVNIPDRMLAPPIDVQGHQAERARSHILLLEISSNEGLGHHFGEGVCQFWITPEDLKAGRFDRVELTADAY